MAYREEDDGPEVAMVDGFYGGHYMVRWYYCSVVMQLWTTTRDSVRGHIPGAMVVRG